MESSSYQSEGTIQEDNAVPVDNQQVSESTTQLTPDERGDIFLQITALISVVEADGNYEHRCLSLLGQINSDRAGVAAAALEDSELLQSLVELFESKWIRMGMY